MDEQFLWQEVAHYVRAWARYGIYWAVGPASVGGVGNAVAIECGPYSVPSAASIDTLLGHTVPVQRIILGVSHEALMYRFPHAHPEWEKRGERNPRFLESGWWGSDLLTFLQPFAARVGVVVIRLAPIACTEGVTLETFVRTLARGIENLPGSWRYAVDPGTGVYVRPEYLTCLKQQAIAHALIDREGCASVVEQMTLPGIFPTDVAVVQMNLGNGRMPAVRDGILGAVRRAVDEGVTLYVHVDDQEAWGGEESDRSRLRILLFVLAMMRLLDRDLGRLSIIRREAA